MDLARVVRAAYPRERGRDRIDPATRTFMAIRIAVNQELEALDRLLSDLPGLMRPGGRAAIISFHSLEDRRVKQAFVQLDRQGQARRLTRKPLTATDAQRQENPRSRSAKLRAVQFQDRLSESREIR
jgi:16S rRNA (cytosine1402-N4)-methyltransferase